MQHSVNSWSLISWCESLPTYWHRKDRPEFRNRVGLTAVCFMRFWSFAALTARTPVVAFVHDLFDQLDTQQRATIADLLLRLHIRALFPCGESAFSRYEPLALTVTARHAAWSANLFVLAVLAAGEVTGTQLFQRAGSACSVARGGDDLALATCWLRVGGAPRNDRLESCMGWPATGHPASLEKRTVHPGSY